MNPDNPRDVSLFKSIIEGELHQSTVWLATVILQSDRKVTNQDRLAAISGIVKHVTDRTKGSGVILFPGGWLSAGTRKAHTIYRNVERNLERILANFPDKIVLCIGIDGRETREWARDQIGIAVSRNGIEAIGRKFHPAPSEKKYVHLAEDHLVKEQGYQRTFKLKGKTYFICACYDSFGLKHNLIPNPGVDVVLDLVHGFLPKGEGNSGDVYFAKHGFAGASKQWGCPVFGAAVFFDRRIPLDWPSGVYWNQGSTSTQSWRYEDNPLIPADESLIGIKEGTCLIRIFKI